MGKNYCKIRKQWCKFCISRGTVCSHINDSITNISSCPIEKSMHTVTIQELINKVSFDKVKDIIIREYPSQKSNIIGYQKVFEHLHTIKPCKSNIKFLQIEEVIENDGDKWHCVSGLTKDKKAYAIEYNPWCEWLSLNIEQNTLDTLSAEEIMAHVLYEMTWAGFDEETIHKDAEALLNDMKEAKMLKNSDK